MTTHTDLLNYLATTFNLQSYLEIGVQNPANNFDKIKCNKKCGVDPNIENRALQNYSCSYLYENLKTTSDDYFENNKSHRYDLIFIDGLHHADQVKLDFENSLECLTDNGFIVIHDTLPTDEKYTHVPRDSKIWFGDVWKFACTLRDYFGISCITVNIDCGCTVIKKLDENPSIRYTQSEITWEYYTKNKDWLLNIASVERFKKEHDRLHSNLI